MERERGREGKGGRGTSKKATLCLCLAFFTARQLVL